MTVQRLLWALFALGLGLAAVVWAMAVRKPNLEIMEDMISAESYKQLLALSSAMPTSIDGWSEVDFDGHKILLQSEQDDSNSRLAENSFYLSRKNSKFWAKCPNGVCATRTILAASDSVKLSDLDGGRKYLAYQTSIGDQGKFKYGIKKADYWPTFEGYLIVPMGTFQLEIYYEGNHKQTDYFRRKIEACLASLSTGKNKP